MRNHYFSAEVPSEQNLYEDLVIESMQIHGFDMIYMPRDIVNFDEIFFEDPSSSFNSAYTVEMYIENVEGFDGEGDLFTKFGVEIRDAATFIVSRRRWNQTVKRHDNEIMAIRPQEGDLIYMPMTNKIFQIMHVEHEQPFYQLSNLPTYSLRCELFEYNDEDIDSGIAAIDSVEQLGYQLAMTITDNDDNSFIVGKNVTQTLSSGVVVSAEVTSYDQDVLTVAHVGSDTEGFHTFTQGDIFTEDDFGNPFSATVLSITEDLTGNTAQNEEIEDESLSFLDFTEDNPFGDPR